VSKHIGRKQRWTRESARRYSSRLGKVLHEQGAWYAVLEYRTLAPAESEQDLARWVPHAARLGPFKRPRNAMVALEEEATILRNRHRKDVLLNERTWGET
jgi:hypothetical protein